MSLRWRLIGGIVLLLSVLWTVTSVWFYFDVRGELRGVLDDRLASSAEMVQGLVRSGGLELPAPGEQRAAPRTAIAASLPTNVTCQLWTTGGRLVTAASRAPRLSANSIPDGFSTHQVGGETWRVFALTVPDSDLRILTSEPLTQRSTLVRDVGVAVTAPFLMALPLTVLLVWAGVQRGLQPLERLRRAVQSRDADSLESLPAYGIPREVSPLVTALNGLFTRLSNAFERERRFTADAAHELRTPLAGIKAQLQIVRAADGATRERALNHVELGLERMNRLVDQMLTLARIESELSAHNQTPESNAGEVARAVVRELEPTAVERGVNLTLLDEGTEIHAPLPAAMLEVAIRNLTENALYHCSAGGSVLITVSGPPLRISVIDEGPGLPPEELTRVTERFYQGETGKTGTGLGLHMVAVVADRYGLQLLLSNREDRPGLEATLMATDEPTLTDENISET
jgi:two-component system sensor histidine kinase QseC